MMKWKDDEDKLSNYLYEYKKELNDLSIPQKRELSIFDNDNDNGNISDKNDKIELAILYKISKSLTAIKDSLLVISLLVMGFTVVGIAYCVCMMAR